MRNNNGENPNIKNRETRSEVEVNSEDNENLKKITVPFIPQSLRKQVLELFHDTPQAGHFGVRKTKNFMRNRAY